MSLQIVPYSEAVAPPQMVVYGVKPYCSERNRRLRINKVVQYIEHGPPVAVLLRSAADRITRRALCQKCCERLGYDLPGGTDVQ